VRPELERLGASLAAISVDDAETSRELAADQELGFPLLSDPKLEVISAYGVAMTGEPIAVPATFVVRPDRTIAWRYVGETMMDRPQSQVVLGVVRRWAAQQR
jgi:peroxiredoxin